MRSPVAILLAFIIASTQFARAQTVEEFYKGKTVKVLIGYTPGGGYDLYARLLARHMGRHIPGNPTIVPENMPGAGSLRAANFLYSVAPKDGLNIGTFSRTTGINPLLDPALKFDGAKFTWLGSITDEVSTCVTWTTSPVKNWQDFLTKPVTLAGQGANSQVDQFARLYKNLFGAPVKLVTGYPGTNEISLAMQRGEVDGMCALSWSTLENRYPEWLRDKKVNVIVQEALKKHPRHPGVPLVLDMTDDKEKLQILKLLNSGQQMARPFAAPPDIPPDRKAALVKAFDATIRDREFLADAKKLDSEINPLSGREIEELLSELYATPKAVIQKATAAIMK